MCGLRNAPNTNAEGAICSGTEVSFNALTESSRTKDGSVVKYSTKFFDTSGLENGGIFHLCPDCCVTPLQFVPNSFFPDEPCVQMTA